MQFRCQRAFSNAHDSQTRPGRLEDCTGFHEIPQSFDRNQSSDKNDDLGLGIDTQFVTRGGTAGGPKISKSHPL